MLDLEQCRTAARSLILLANASDSELDRDAYYEQAKAWLSQLEAPQDRTERERPRLTSPD